MASLLFLALPLVIYLSLATLPKGQPAVMGLGVAGLLIALGFLIMPGLRSVLMLALAGAGMAAVAQSLRWLAGPRLAPRLYVALLGLLPLLSFVALMFSLGD